MNSLDFNTFICIEEDEQVSPHIPQEPLQLLTCFYKERISETYSMLWDNIWGQRAWLRLRCSVYMEADRTIDIVFWGVTVKLWNAKGNATNSCSSTRGKACYFIDLLHQLVAASSLAWICTYWSSHFTSQGSGKHIWLSFPEAIRVTPQTRRTSWAVRRVELPLQTSFTILFSLSDLSHSHLWSDLMLLFIPQSLLQTICSVKVKLLKAHALFPGHFFIRQRNIDLLILSCILLMFINTFCKPRTVLDELGYPDLKELSLGRKWMCQYIQSSSFQMAGDSLQFHCQTVPFILCNFESFFSLEISISLESQYLCQKHDYKTQISSSMRTTQMPTKGKMEKQNMVRTYSGCHSQCFIPMKRHHDKGSSY